MQRVFVLGMDGKALMPCRPSRAKELLKAGKAVVFRRYPFTLIMKKQTGKQVQPVAFKVDPGSKITGGALVADFKRGKEVIWAAEIEHRGQAVRDNLLSRRALRHGRRNRKTRYRKQRFLNRTRPESWLPPSLKSRVSNIATWLSRLRRWSPISSVAMELVKFDTQKMKNPEISGVEYQQGTLAGYEVREYLLEKWGRKCAYCGVENVPLEVEHIIPKSRGGSNGVSNLAVSCEPCNKTKGNSTAAEFGHPDVQAKAETPLKDAAAVNATRWRLFERLKKAGLPVECGTGGRTKFNRTVQGYRKAHWTDAACAGVSGRFVRLDPLMLPILIRAVGHGIRQMCGTDRFGFPKRHRMRQKSHHGFQTGDIVRAVVPNGKRKGTHIGVVLCRASGSFDIKTRGGRAAGISYRHCVVVQRADGYSYAVGGGASFPGLKAGASAPSIW